MQDPIYSRLCKEHREVIYRMNKAGNSQSVIAQAIGFSQSTVSKELSRNRGLRGYRPKQAQSLTDQRSQNKVRRGHIITGEFQVEVERRLHLKHSPEQVSLGLERSFGSVSHETIYRYIRRNRAAGGLLYLELRINGKRRYRRRAGNRRSKIPNRIGIENRPATVTTRKRYGDWEVDLIEGAKGSGYLLSLYERKSRTGLLEKLSTKTKENTTAAIIRSLQGYRVKTITYDNGLEFAGHEAVSEELQAKGYFCQPYHSWEKGGVENYNGLVRQYFPKGSDFSLLTDTQIKEVELEINERPRKILLGKSPSEFNHRLTA
jgi:IS30 family transposase